MIDKKFLQITYKEEKGDVSVSAIINYTIIEITLVTADKTKYTSMIDKILAPGIIKKVSVSEDQSKIRSWYCVVEGMDHTHIFKKNIAAIKSGLYNMFKGNQNLLAKEIDDFVTNSFGLSRCTITAVNLDGGLDIAEVKNFYEEKKKIRQQIRMKNYKDKSEEKGDEASSNSINKNNRGSNNYAKAGINFGNYKSGYRKEDRERFPQYKPTYSAEEWKAISQAAYELRLAYKQAEIKKYAKKEPSHNDKKEIQPEEQILPSKKEQFYKKLNAIKINETNKKE